MKNDKNGHRWKFYRAGGIDQVRFVSGDDIANLDKLDPKLWVALACPVKGLEFDERTLALIDGDKDGRVRLSEITDTVAFLKARLRTPDLLLDGSSSLALASINDTTPEGKSALASAKRILADLGKPEATVVTFDDIADPVKIFAGTKFNGDGIIPAEAAGDEATAGVIRDIIATQGFSADRSGLPGVDKARIDTFFADLKAFVAWADAGAADAATAPFGDKTAAAFAAVKAVRAKIDDFFSRCRLAAFDVRTLAAVNRAESDYLAVAAKDLSVDAAEVAGFPIARVEAGRSLPFGDAINPAWAEPVARLYADAVVPAYGSKTSLSETEWKELKAKLAAYEAWTGKQPATKATSLGLDRARAVLGSGAESEIASLLARDAALEAEAKGIDAVEKLVRLNRDFRHLLENFISFADFYNPNKLAIFQAGRLYLDSRECHLCIKVDDPAKHAALAGLSKCYLAYCDVSRRNEAGTIDKMQILAVFSQGDGDYLMLGRNGVFVDRKGRDWDATITKIIDAPISIRQAFWSPYKKFIRMIEEQVAKRAAAAEEANNAKLAASAADVANADKAKPVEKKSFDVGTIAALGVGLGAIGTVFGSIVTGFMGLSWYMMPVCLLGVVLAISGPSMIIAALKLRQRNMGPILDANGWAVNGRVKVNIPFGTSLTEAAKIPENSDRTLDDPFAVKPSPWPKIIGVLALVAAIVWGLWHFNVGFFDRFLADTLGKPEWVHKTQDQIDQEKADKEAAMKLKADAKAKADADAKAKAAQ